MGGERFYGSRGDCRWLRETVLRGYPVPAFGSFTLEGNEDCPLVIRLYARRKPLMTDTPVVYRLEQDPQSTLSLYVRS